MKIDQMEQGHNVYTLLDETGTGIMDIYEVFPGIYLSYNDFKLRKCESTYTPGGTMFGVEHCREGKIEWDCGNGQYAYLGSGCFMPCDYSDQGGGHFEFPSCTFQGMTLGFDLPRAKEGFPKEIPVDLELLQKKITEAGTVDLSKNARSTYVLGLIYEAQHLSLIHKKLAALDFILFLDDLRWNENHAEPLYFPRQQVLLVKKMERFLKSNLDHRYTLKELSDRFSMPVSTIRRVFPGVFGYSVTEYIKKKRIEEAMRLLRETDRTITEISTTLGYENPSKFSAVFKSYLKVSPQIYRSEQ